MQFELFIALRYLFTRKHHSFISIISVVSVLGVALGVAALIIVLGVMTGFSNELRDKILGVNAHVMVMSLEGGFSDYESYLEKASQVPGVLGVTPFIYSEVMLSSANGVKGVVLRGIDPRTAGSVLSIENNMKVGKLSDLDNTDGPPRIIIGKELSKRLALGIGSRVNLLSPSGKRTASGFTPKVEIFDVCGVFQTGMFEYDSTLAFVSLDAARKLLGLKRIRATGLELKVDDVYQAAAIAKRVKAALGPTVYTRNWMEMNANLFSALELEKTAMAIILVLIVLVGSFSIITTLVMMVMEKTKDIAILMSMGATRRNIRRIFMLQGSAIGFVGTFFGYLLGIGANLLLQEYQFIKLPQDVYSMDHLPVQMETLDLVGIGVAAMLLCFVATIYPALQASRLNPADALRFE